MENLIGERVIVYDRYLFAVPVKGVITEISEKDGAYAVTFDGNNPGGSNVTEHDGKFFHRQQCRLESEIEPFEREDRYLVFKKSDIRELSGNWRTVLDRVADEIGFIRLNRGKDERTPGIDCVVVEADWPEYEQVWAMIEARVRQEA